MSDIDARAFKLIAAATNIIRAHKIQEIDGRMSFDRKLIDELVGALKGYGIVYVTNFGVVTKE